jgi:hypothetical protein
MCLMGSPQRLIVGWRTFETERRGVAIQIEKIIG